MLSAAAGPVNVPGPVRGEVLNGAKVAFPPSRGVC